jgi:hypothetical protein
MGLAVGFNSDVIVLKNTQYWPNEVYTWPAELALKIHIDAPKICVYLSTKATHSSKGSKINLTELLH